MGKKSKSKPANWYVSCQDNREYYESQQAVIVAVDSIVSSCESGIWCKDFYLFLGYLQEGYLDSDLLSSHYSTNVLVPTSFHGMFRIDLFAKNKEDWIFKYGSDLLQQSLRAGYDCNEGYLAERLARDYPGFTAKEWSRCKKVDTPNEVCLHACSSYEYSYCSNRHEDYYITIDNYLGKYQLVKLIDPNLEITRVKPQIEFTEISDPLMELNATLKRLSEKYPDPSAEVIDRKQEWILEYGSDLLGQSLMAGYDCGDRYLQERIAYDYPGFEINLRNYPKVNSPDERCLYACLGYEGSYCSSNNKNYYITIDNFLGKYQLVKSIDASTEVIEENSIVPTAANTFATRIRRYGDSINNSSQIKLVLAATSAYLLMMGFVGFAAYLLLS